MLSSRNSFVQTRKYFFKEYVDISCKIELIFLKNRVWVWSLASDSKLKFVSGYACMIPGDHRLWSNFFFFGSDRALAHGQNYPQNKCVQTSRISPKSRLKGCTRGHEGVAIRKSGKPVTDDIFNLYSITTCCFRKTWWNLLGFRIKHFHEYTYLFIFLFEMRIQRSYTNENWKNYENE